MGFGQQMVLSVMSIHDRGSRRFTTISGRYPLCLARQRATVMIDSSSKARLRALNVNRKDCSEREMSEQDEDMTRNTRR